jgi:hypothetical protein
LFYLLWVHVLLSAVNHNIEERDTLYQYFMFTCKGNCCGHVGKSISQLVEKERPISENFANNSTDEPRDKVFSTKRLISVKGKRVLAQFPPDSPPSSAEVKNE